MNRTGIITLALLSATAGAGLGWCISGFTPSFDSLEECVFYYSVRSKSSKGADLAVDACYSKFGKMITKQNKPDLSGIDLSNTGLE